MNTIKAKYKGSWKITINKIKTEGESLVKVINNYVDSLDKPQEMDFILKVYFETKSGQGFFELRTCYATSELTLPFIEELEKNVKSLKLDSFTKLKFPEPDITQDMFIDNNLIDREYTVKFLNKTKEFTLGTLVKHFKETKVLRKTRRIYFSSESHNIEVKIAGKTKPMFKGYMFFDKEEDDSYIEDFKRHLQFLDNVLNKIASSSD